MVKCVALPSIPYPMVCAYLPTRVRVSPTNQISKPSNFMVQRTTYRRRLSYNTTSNKTRVVKTPGGKLVRLYVTKKGGKVKCGDCGIALQGIPSVRPSVYMRLNKSSKNVTRAYGGSRCYKCVRSRFYFFDLELFVPFCSMNRELSKRSWPSSNKNKSTRVANL